MLAFLLVTAAAATLLVGGRYLRARRNERRERSLLLATARIWGIATTGDESVEDLRRQVHAARLAGPSGDPIETAARALRAQRGRRTPRT